MNLDFKPTLVTAFFGRLLTELREKRLWPVAAGLVVAIAAVPFLLLKSSNPAPLAQAPQGAPPPSAATSLPAINVQTTPAQSRISGSARDPFAQQASGTTSTTSTAAAAASRTTATASGLAGSTATTGSSGSRTTGVGAATGMTVTLPTATKTAPPSITQNAKPTPTLASLRPTQSYHVTLAITNSANGVDTIDPLERLSVLPSPQKPLLFELGVLQGGSRVLFVVQPGTIVSGPGTCTPGPIDCEILSLAQDQTEGLASQSPTGVVPGPLFAVTGITADQDPSAAAANRMRRQASPDGQALLSRSPLSALSLFEYEPSIGAVVDERNLTVVGN